MQTAIITGGNLGLGYHCAKQIALASDWQVVIACRNRARASEAVKQLIAETGNQQITALDLELASLASVRQFVDNFVAAQLPPLRAIVCNAGIQIITGKTFTADGFETTFAVNHLGHFLLVNLLLRQLSAPARIVFVSSGTHDPAQRTGMPIPRYQNARALAYGETPPNLKIDNPAIAGRRAYTTSKLCNLLCAYELARRLSADGNGDAITVNAFDPGLMPGSGLARDYGALQRFAWNFILPALRLFMHNVNSTSRSGQALARLIPDPALANLTGKYFEGLKEIQSSRESYDLEKAAELWQTSLELVKLTASEISNS